MNTQIPSELDKLLIQKNIATPVNTTIADVVMYLYQHYNIWIAVEPDLIDKKIHKIISWQCSIHTFSDSNNKVYEYFALDTLTEAYEVAIAYILKKLI